MKFVLSLILLLFTTLMIIFSAHAIAQGSYAVTMKANQQSSKQQVRVKNTTQAAQLAQRRFGGKVLKVQAQKSGYKVKLIKKDGHIIAVFIDAKSGRISGR
ncbi:MAG: PepSY domain-containing protein [Colwellia sp.]|nr:PepSY domain-containing protein [Colwellia sp.]